MIVNRQSLDREADLIRERYLRRTQDVQLKSLLPPHRYMANLEKQRAMLMFLGDVFGNRLADCALLEIGAGFGDNLLQMLVWGLPPDKMVGNDLMPDRCEHARHRLPESCAIHPGDALQLELAAGQFDIVLASTVFSSILDSAFRHQLADHMWSLVAPGGGVLWYDFVHNNPSNPDVRKVSVPELRDLFPGSIVRFKRVSLAAPLARLVCRVHPSLYTVLNMVPFLRTHVVAWIQKPR
jgi:hypothetical protein